MQGPCAEPTWHQRSLSALARRQAVTWLPFAGGHEIPAEVVVALNQFLQQLPLRR